MKPKNDKHEDEKIIRKPKRNRYNKNKERKQNRVKDWQPEKDLKRVIEADDFEQSLMVDDSESDQEYWEWLTRNDDESNAY